MDRYLSTHKEKLTWKGNNKDKEKNSTNIFLCFFFKKNYTKKDLGFKQNICVVKNLQSESSAWGHGIKFNQVSERCRHSCIHKFCITADVWTKAWENRSTMLLSNLSSEKITASQDSPKHKHNGESAVGIKLQLTTEELHTQHSTLVHFI
jgi:hypothetical protein